MNTQLNVRELYCPSHFGNSYEVALSCEMTEILTEAKFWGFNRYSDWFDTIDLYDIYHKNHQHFNMPEAIWARKFSNYTCAHQLGFDLSLVITPNHVFSNQVTPENEAVKDPHIFGQLVCPSKPGVIELILDNYRNLFKDFVQQGLPLRALAACPYDYGGCACEACQPWIATFGKLYREIVLLARDFFGVVEEGLIGWWWSDDDHQEFCAWAKREAPGLFHNLAFHLPYGETDYRLRPIPDGTRERAFVHIGYGEKSNLDSYGHYGPPIAPTRLETTARYLFSRDADGFMAYSEGICDEINKALLAGLTSGQFISADDVLKEYARRHLSMETDGWVEWMRMVGDAFNLDVKQARQLFDKLVSSSTKGWRLQQLEERLIMAEADVVVRSRREWDTERINAAEKFWSAKERLYRQVWRLGLGRAIFRFDAYAPDWHQEYLQVKGLKPEARESQVFGSQV